MNGKRAKQARKLVYKDNLSPKYRKYKLLPNGQLIADKNRKIYQKTKKILLKCTPEALRRLEYEEAIKKESK